MDGCPREYNRGVQSTIVFRNNYTQRHLDRPLQPQCGICIILGTQVSSSLFKPTSLLCHVYVATTNFASSQVRPTPLVVFDLSLPAEHSVDAQARPSLSTIRLPTSQGNCPLYTLPTSQDNLTFQDISIRAGATEANNAALDS
jgi:hypothetical protein